MLHTDLVNSSSTLLCSDITFCTIKRLVRRILYSNWTRYKDYTHETVYSRINRDNTRNL